MITAMASMHVSTTTQDRSVTVLAWMMFLIPAVGVPSDLMLQDTLKSAIAAFGVLCASIIYVWGQRKCTRQLQWHHMIWMPIVLMLYALGSMVWSHTYLAGVEAIRWFLVSLLMWLGINAVNAERWPKLLYGIHGGAMVASLWVALQFWFDFQFFPQAAPPASTFINRNFFAEYVVCALPFSVWLLVSQKSMRCQLTIAGSISLILVALLMTGTRSALLALSLLAPALVVIVTRYRHHLALGQWHSAQKLIVAALLVFGTLGLATLPSGNAQINRESGGVTTPLGRSYHRAAAAVKPAEYSSGSFSIRIVLWRATARMMLDRAMAGVGAGAWEVEIPRFETLDTRFETDYYPHNEYLQLLSEYGLIVGGLSLAFWVAYWLFAIGTTLRLPPAAWSRAPPRAFALASLMALFVVSGAGFPWHLASCAALLSLCLALVARSDVESPAMQRLHLLRWSEARTTISLTFLGCCLAVAGYITLQGARAEYHIVQALKLSAKLSKATALDVNMRNDMKSEMLRNLRIGIGINPHYRRLSALVAEPLSSQGDWPNAIWILESVAASRPHIAAIWQALAQGYSNLGKHDAALHALNEVKRLRPASIETSALEVSVLSRAGMDQQATDILETHYTAGTFDVQMTEMGYAIGYKTRNWALAIRSLELRNQIWPEQAADGHMRLGKIYLEPSVQNSKRALEEFKRGIDAVPFDQKDNFRRQVPQAFQEAM
jgi:O-antigen ligase